MHTYHHVKAAHAELPDATDYAADVWAAAETITSELRYKKAELYVFTFREACDFDQLCRLLKDLGFDSCHYPPQHFFSMDSLHSACMLHTLRVSMRY